MRDSPGQICKCVLGASREESEVGHCAARTQWRRPELERPRRGAVARVGNSFRCCCVRACVSEKEITRHEYGRPDARKSPVTASESRALPWQVIQKFKFSTARFRFRPTDSLARPCRPLELISDELNQNAFEPIVSNGILKAAVVQLVHAALSSREELSARRIRRTLEAEFACDLNAKKDLILRTIAATLEDEYVQPFNRADDGAACDVKRRKLAEMQDTQEEEVHGNGAVKRGRLPQTTGAQLALKPSHFGQRTCEKCDYRCTYPSELTRHMRRHTGERPYACDECDYRCAHNSDLTKHMRTHSDQLSRACDQCDFRC